MNKERARELLGKFWEYMPDSEIVDESIYLIDTFIEWLYDEGYEVEEKDEGDTVEKPKKMVYPKGTPGDLPCGKSGK